MFMRSFGPIELNDPYLRVYGPYNHSGITVGYGTWRPLFASFGSQGGRRKQGGPGMT